MALTDDELWERLKATLPVCCGEPMQPGGDEALGPVLVCTSCSTIEFVSPDWIADRIDAIRDRAGRKP